jgi:Spy/CpxP family protein refolding chaperone
MTSIRNVLTGTLLAGGALLAAATSFSIASAADEPATAAATPAPSGGHWRHHGGGPWHMYSKLGLTAEQKASIKTIMETAKPQMESLHQRMQANQQKLMQSKPDDSNHSSVVAEVAQANAALALQRTTQADELRTQIYAVLTPAQKTQLATLQAQRAAKAAARQSAGASAQ